MPNCGGYFGESWETFIENCRVFHRPVVVCRVQRSTLADVQFFFLLFIDFFFFSKAIRIFQFLFREFSPLIFCCCYFSVPPFVSDSVRALKMTQLLFLFRILTDCMTNRIPSSLLKSFDSSGSDESALENVTVDSSFFSSSPFFFFFPLSLSLFPSSCI